MRIKLYGLPTCFRCKTAKMMLDKRNMCFDYIEITQQEYEQDERELPRMTINGKEYEGKDVLIQIRKLKKR